MGPGSLGSTATLVAGWATDRPRHYSVSYLVALAVIVLVGYLTIRRRRDHETRSDGRYRPSQGRNEFELHPSPPRRAPGAPAPGAPAAVVPPPAGPGPSSGAGGPPGVGALPDDTDARPPTS